MVGVSCLCLEGASIMLCMGYEFYSIIVFLSNYLDVLLGSLGPLVSCVFVVPCNCV